MVISIVRVLPKPSPASKKPMRMFLCVWGVSLVILLSAFVYAFWRHVTGTTMYLPAQIAFIGLLLLAVVGGAAGRCIDAVAREREN